MADTQEEKKETLMQALSRIQKELKAPKGQMNSFGGYKYRSSEDILEAVKPLLGETALVLNDEVVLIGDRFYVKATAKLILDDDSVSAVAYAREPLEKKGMDTAQITGATSSYARKYALNGLFCIDDTKDADATNDHGKGKSDTKADTKAPKTGEHDIEFMKDLEPTEEDIIKYSEKLESAKDLKELKAFWSMIPPMAQDRLFPLKETLKTKLK